MHRPLTDTERQQFKRKFGRPIPKEKAAEELAEADQVHQARLAKMGIKGGVDVRQDLRARIERADAEIARLTAQRAHLATQLATLKP